MYPQFIAKIRKQYTHCQFFYNSILLRQCNDLQLETFQIIDGQLHFVVSQYGKTSTLKIASSKVSDGDWHNVTVTVTGMYLS